MPDYDAEPRGIDTFQAISYDPRTGTSDLRTATSDFRPCYLKLCERIQLLQWKEKRNCQYAKPSERCDQQASSRRWAKGGTWMPEKYWAPVHAAYVQAKGGSCLSCLGLWKYLLRRWSDAAAWGSCVSAGLCTHYAKKSETSV